MITLAQRLNWTKFNLVQKDLTEILNIIKDGSYVLHDRQLGDYTLKDITEAIRNEADENKQNLWKVGYLPVVTFNGIWNGSRISNYSNVTALDFDHVHTQVESELIMNSLMNSACVVAVFRTFKRHRLKAIILHDNTDPLRHKDMYEKVMVHFGVNNLDESCKDLSRKNYLPWDEDLWVNPSPVPFHYVPTVQNTVISSSVIPLTKKAKSPHSIINIFNSSWGKNHPEYWQRGQRASSIFKCACQLCEYGVPQDMAEEYFIKKWLDYDMEESEIIGHVNGAYGSAKFDSKIFINQVVG